MDKQKQIEEMYDDISERLIGVLDCETMSLAIHLHGLCYRKIPENAVVLTKEEHQKYLAFKIIEPQVRGCLDRERELQKQVKILTEENKELYNDNTTLIAGSILQKEQVERDTAKEIITMIDGTCASMKTYLCSIIAKRYGVEVK